MLGRGGIAPPEKAVVALPDNLAGWGLGEELATDDDEDLTGTVVAGLGE